MDSKAIVEEKIALVSELKQAMLNEVRNVVKGTGLKVSENLDLQGAVDIATNLNYHRRVFDHALGLMVWYISNMTDYGEFERIIQEEIGLNIRKAQRLKKRAKFFYQFPNEFVRELSGSKKDFLMSLPEELLDGLEDEEGTLGDIDKDEIIKLSVKDLEVRLKKAVDGTTVALQKELDAKSKALADMGKELQQLRSANARLRDPAGRDTEKENAIARYCAELDAGINRLVNFLEDSPISDDMRSLGHHLMVRLDKSMDLLRGKMIDLTEESDFTPDPEVMNRLNGYYETNGSPNEKTD